MLSFYLFRKIFTLDIRNALKVFLLRLYRLRRDPVQFGRWCLGFTTTICVHVQGGRDFNSTLPNGKFSETSI